MDSKKTINVILIIVVLSLWGTVGYKYFNRFFMSDEIAYDFTDAYGNTTVSIIEKDTFDLQPLAKDPFLNKVLFKPVRSSKIVRTTPKVKIGVKPKVTTPFPMVHYFGYIKSKDKKEELILLKINNRLERVRLNSNVSGLVVKKIYKDSVIVFFNKETKCFKKS
jgi:hypothetical protein